MSGTESTGAKRVWDSMNTAVEASQAIVGPGWLASDTAARACGADGVQWVINRFGPGTQPDDRVAKLEELERRWDAKGWKPVRSDFGGDAPGVMLRYPAASSLDDGFFIEFSTTRHGSTLQLQTPCTQGVVDDLNREKYGERHTNTPPDIPGAASPSASAEPTEGATP
ncbi:hypothetical protein DEJ28_15110 [Curtobacterium sp. MCPF17_002]|uniref:hypothetical protein n=1 Tax=Curtobacterium sp. MCPF17_002 TaxID=2175645 RepID=UPI000DAA1F71|nr:hypothetical protein [Curtobacterium sp. MCPF17_002]WIB76967.1 hypothetical protein DEJ28_15110 [Curtobacterium sp. MCPF17_002]